MKTVLERFKSKFKIVENGCWEWTACIGSGGYGTFNYKGKTQRSHRIAWELYCGEIPVNMDVLHRCDVRNCVNPNHLFIGTHTDNMQDASEKGRLSNRKNRLGKFHTQESKNKISIGRIGKYGGESNPRAILSESDIVEIRQINSMYGLSKNKVALEYGISVYTINDIVKYRSWKHI